MAAASLFRPGFIEFYRQAHFSDVTILTSSKTYKAHRMILAFSSEFFEAMLLGEFQETQTAVIDLRKTYDPYNIFPEVMKILYSGRIELSHTKVVPLLAMSDVLLIKSINEVCSEYISAHLNKSTAMTFLLCAIELHQERLAQQCLNVLASSFIHICDDTDFTQLDVDHFIQLICHPRLAVKNEWNLLQVILRYLETNHSPTAQVASSASSSSVSTSESGTQLLSQSSEESSKPASTDYPDESSSESLILKLMKNVRFYFFTFEQLLKANANPFVPKQLLVEPLLARLHPHESPKTSLPGHLQFNPRLSWGIRFEVSDAEKPRGIVHWLGTREGTSPWSNPATSGMVNVHASSVERGNTHSLVDLEPQELWTHDVPASWLSLDLGRFRVLPSAYMLRHGGNYRADSLRNWDFQGSVDGKSWVALKRHSNDPTLSAPFAVKTFLLDKAASVPYQWFRIIQTGHNSTNHNFLVLSGFEIFGELWDKDAWTQQQSLLNPSSTHSPATPQNTPPIPSPSISAASVQSTKNE